MTNTAWFGLDSVSHSNSSMVQNEYTSTNVGVEQVQGGHRKRSDMDETTADRIRYSSARRAACRGVRLGDR